MPRSTGPRAPLSKNPATPSKRRVDCDNTVPKFILDGFSESGFIIDDDGKHLHSLTLKTGYDKDNPRTEIKIIVK